MGAGLLRLVVFSIRPKNQINLRGYVTKGKKPYVFSSKDFALEKACSYS